jgi:6-pyruvoyltetrahydropterin/6-carboxytetrahydropterin synthase
MKTSITKTFTFEAAHSLPAYEGPCQRVHGHSYVLEVTVTGPLQTSGSDAGMVADFRKVSDVVKKEIVEPWDHTFLNDMVSFTTTAELLAEECMRRLKNAGLPVSRVRLWETAKCYAEVEV